MQNPEEEGTEVEIAVRSTDMDADRCVNNAVYFQYFEQSRLEHLLRWGVIKWPPPRGGGRTRFAVAQTAAQFRLAAVHGDRLSVLTRTVAVSSRSFTLSYTVRRASDGVLLCDGSSVQVWLDREGQATDIPIAARAALTRSIHAAIDNPSVR